jgi:2-polyprenyl-3-methyl-5-hydroxy-6-metoxy-1,4-benzoquinol methylase
MLPPVEGLQGLDIGCGDGANTRAVVRRGARMRGIDVAPTFVRQAKAGEQAEPLAIVYRAADAVGTASCDSRNGSTRSAWQGSSSRSWASP